MAFTVLIPPIKTYGESVTFAVKTLRWRPTFYEVALRTTLEVVNLVSIAKIPIKYSSI